MTRRMIDASLWQNEKFTRMPLGAQMLQIGIITHADDQGRVKANPSFLRNQIFPDNEDITNADIQTWLGLMVKNGTILVYSADEKQYAQLLNWWKYQSLQYASPSQFPRPEGWKDRIRKTVTKGFIATCNWLTVDGTQLEDTCDQDGNPLPKKISARPPEPSTPSVNGHSPVKQQPVQVKTSHQSASHSPESSPDYSPESSPEPTTKLNRIELNRTELNRGEYARETKSSEPTPLPPPSLPSNHSTGDPYMDVALKRQQDRQANNGRHQAKRTSLWPDIDAKVSAAERLPLVERLIDMHGLRAAIDVAEDDAKLADMHKLAADLYVMGFQTLSEIEAVYERFKDEWKGKTPAGRQLISIASAMKQASAPAQTKPPQTLTLKQWCMKHYHTDNPKFVQVVPEATIYEQYNQYRNQQAH